jgi:hypothetical protein
MSEIEILIFQTLSMRDYDVYACKYRFKRLGFNNGEDSHCDILRYDNAESGRRLPGEFSLNTFKIFYWITFYCDQKKNQLKSQQGIGPSPSLFFTPFFLYFIRSPPSSIKPVNILSGRWHSFEHKVSISVSARKLLWAVNYVTYWGIFAQSKNCEASRERSYSVMASQTSMFLRQQFDITIMESGVFYAVRAEMLYAE